MNRFSLLLKGSALQTVEAVISIIIGFVTLPLMLSFLGAEKYGIWILVGGFAGLLYIFDLGFASSVTRGVAASIATKNFKKTNGIINSALIIYSALASLMALLIVAICFFYRPGSEDVISHSELVWVIFLVGMSMVIEFPFKAFSGVTSAFLRYDLIASYRIIIKLMNVSVMLYLLYAGYGLIAIACWQMISGFISNMIFFALARWVFKDLKLSFSFLEKRTFNELFGYSSWAFVIDLNRLAKERIDIFFIGGFISLGAVSVYYVSVRVVEYSLQLLYKSLNLSLPILTGDYSKGDRPAFTENLLLVNRLYTYCAVVAMCFYVIWGKTIFYYWMGSNFLYQEAYYILLILLVGRLSALCTNGFNSALYASAKHKLLAWFNIAETIVTALLLTVFLWWLEMGAIMAAIAIAAPLVISRMFILPIVSAQYMEVVEPKRLIMFSARPLGIVLIVGFSKILLPLSAEVSLSHLTFSIFALAIVVVYGLFDLTQRERALVLRLINPIIKISHRV